ncbi:MAG: hypothetical protein ACMG6S_36805, partial [Byssovorax sp.]
MVNRKIISGFVGGISALLVAACSGSFVGSLAVAGCSAGTSSTGAGGAGGAGGATSTTGVGGAGGGATSSSTVSNSTGSDTTSSSSGTGTGGGATSSSSGTGGTGAGATSSSSGTGGTGGGATSSSSGTGGGLACQPSSQEACYSGPAGTQGLGLCVAGLRTCAPDGSGHGPCEGEVTPIPETCEIYGDEDCDGLINEEGNDCVCMPGTLTSCFTG